MLSGEKKRKIEVLKTNIQKCPHPSSKEEFENFSAFFFSLSFFCLSIENKNPNLHLREKYSYHLEMLWNHLLREFMDPIWSYDEKGYNSAIREKYWQESCSINTSKLKILLKEAAQGKELKRFFTAYPYIEVLISIEEFLNKKSAPIEDHIAFYNLICDTYLPILEQYNSLQPLIVLREHLKLMLARDDFDKEFYLRYMKGATLHLKNRVYEQRLDLVFLSLFISTSISYDLRESAGFKKFNWNAFDGLYRIIFKNPNVISSNRLHEIAEKLEKYVDNLIFIQLGEIQEDIIDVINVDDIALINAAENITPAFQIIQFYLDTLTQIDDDYETSRLAILRTITAIGEAIHSINILLPEAQRKAFKIITDLRDHIVHSSTLDALYHIDELVKNKDNTSLFDCLIELKNLQSFFKVLKDRFDNKTENLISVPFLKQLISFEANFKRVRHQDDRDEQISVDHRRGLLNSLPDDDFLANAYFNEVNTFVTQGAKLSKQDFIKSCPNLSTKDARIRYEQIIELKKITALRNAIAEQNVDFDRIKLNTKDKESLTQIKNKKDYVSLENFLNEHERKVVSSCQEPLSVFLQSIKTIDIKDFKKKLREFATEKIRKIEKKEFEKAINVVFGENTNHQKFWKTVYTILTDKYIDSLKRYQIVQLECTIKNISRLMQESNSMFNGKRIDFESDLIRSISCEMLYGFCSDGFKRIKKLIDKMYDYQDETLYFFRPNHPLAEVKKLLTHAIEIRNQMFHFERTFEGKNLYFARMSWFGSIQQLCFGTYFPNAIVITPYVIRREPSLSSPSVRLLEDFLNLIKKDLPRDENFLNLYEARIKEKIHDSKMVNKNILLETDYLLAWQIQADEYRKTLVQSKSTLSAPADREYRLRLFNTAELLSGHLISTTADGDCFFHAIKSVADLNFTRSDLVERLLEKASDFNIRRAFSLEIKQFLYLGYTSGHENEEENAACKALLTPEFIKHFEKFMLSENQLQEGVDSARLVLREIDTKGLKPLELIALLENAGSEYAKTLKKFYEDVLEADKALSEYCTQKNVFEGYVTNYLKTARGYVAFSRDFSGEEVQTTIDIINQLFYCNIQVYLENPKDRSELILVTRSISDKPPIPIFHDGVNHFWGLKFEKSPSPLLFSNAAIGEQAIAMPSKRKQVHTKS